MGDINYIIVGRDLPIFRTVRVSSLKSLEGFHIRLERALSMSEKRGQWFFATPSRPPPS